MEGEQGLCHSASGTELAHMLHLIQAGTLWPYSEDRACVEMHGHRHWVSRTAVRRRQYG